MNRYILIHRLTWPAILLLLGVVALLDQLHLVRFSIFVPLLLILVGALKLAERAVLATEPNPEPYTGAMPGGANPAGNQATSQAANPQPSGSTAPMHDFQNKSEGGIL